MKGPLPLATIEDGWRSLADAIGLKNAPRTQRVEMRRAFYGGATVVLAALRQYADSGASDDAGVTLLESMQDECTEFGRNVGTPRE
jgi:hypothetical protein